MQGNAVESLFIPPSEQSAGPVIAAFFADIRPTPTVGPCTGGVRRLFAYMQQASLLWPRTARSMTIVTETGGVDMVSLTDGDRGPHVVASLAPPSPALLGASFAQSTAAVCVTCATMVPAEVALRQWYDDHGSIGPTAGASTPPPVSPYTPAAGGGINESQLPLLHERSTAPSGSTSDSGVSDATWAATINGQWRGVVGTDGGCVYAFSSIGYTFGFSTRSSAAVVSCAAVIMHGAQTPAAGQSGKSSPRAGVGMGPRRKSATDLDEDGESVSLLTVAGGGLLSTVGFVTLQADGRIASWRRSRSDGLVLFPPVVLQAPTLLGRVGTLHVAHLYPTRSMLDGARGFVGLAEALDTPPVAATAADEYSPADSPASDAGQRRFPSFNPATALPIVSVMLYVARGRLLAVGAFGTAAEAPVPIDARVLAHPTAIATSGTAVYVARGKKIFTVSFAPPEAERLLTAPASVGPMSVEGSLGVAGCADGSVIVFYTENGSILASHQSCDGRMPRHVSMHLQSLLIALVDDRNGAVEVVRLPDVLLRLCEPAADEWVVQQAAVLRHAMAAVEGSARTSKRTSSELCAIARTAVPACVSAYLTPQHITV